MAATDAVIWMVCEGDGVVEAVRIARGGGVLDVTTIPAPDVTDVALAARAGSAALAIWTRVGDLSWVELADDGTIVGPTPVTPAPRRGVLVAEPDGYLLYAYEEWTAVRFTPDGTAGAPFDLFEPNNYTGNSREHAQTVDRAHTLLIYDWSSRDGTPSSIRARAIAPGAQQNPELVVAEVPLTDGEIVNVECGCNAGGADRGGSLAMLAVALLASRRRRTLR
jgi:MYXO-CTERM domain-containing protein